MTAHAIDSSEAPSVPLAVRYLDLIALALVLPVFVLAGLPLLGYAAAGGAWVAQRGIQHLITARAKASEDMRTVAGLLTGSMIGRAWLVALSIFGIGMYEREAGLAAAVLTIFLFTVYFTAQMVARPFEAPGRRGAGRA